MKILLGTGDIKNYNWCRFTMEGIIEIVDSWKHNPDNHFCRLMIFLAVIYVSSCILYFFLFYL